MALWVVEQDENGMTLRYSPSAVPGRVAFQRCGACEMALSDDLLAWVADQAERADQVLTPEGLFVKVFGPGGGPAWA